jgi:hypothetical protein
MAANEHEAGEVSTAACGCGVEHGDDAHGRHALAVDAAVKDRNL